MQVIVKELEKFGFSYTEGQVYVTLLHLSQANGSQIARSLNISRSTVYSALNNLYNKGIIYLVSGDCNEYRPKNPTQLVRYLKETYLEAAHTLDHEFSKLNFNPEILNYNNIYGTDNFILKTKELILEAKKEIYMNTCCDLQIFAREVKKAASKGVRIIVFTFDPINGEDLPIELYSNQIDHEQCRHKAACNEIRMMLVIDLKKALIASSRENEEVIGTFTDNPLLVSIVSEHIHHDIYLLKLKQKYDKELIDRDILINSLLENILN